MAGLLGRWKQKAQGLLQQPGVALDATRGLLMGATTDVLGYPVDVLSDAMRPFGYDVAPQNTVGSSDWLAQKLTAPTGSRAETVGRFVGGLLSPGPTEMLQAAGLLKKSAPVQRIVDPVIQDMWTNAAPDRLRRIVKSYEDDLYRLGGRDKDPENWDKWSEHVVAARKTLAARGEPLYEQVAKPTTTPKASEFSPTYVKQAARHFGLTSDIREAGYILPEGDLLDLSGKAIGGQPGMRSLDHREAAQLFDDLPGGTDGMLSFMKKARAIRFQWSGRKGEAAMASINFEPTQEQANALADAVSKSRGGLILDIDDPITGSTIASRDFSEVSPREIMRAIREALNR